MRHLRSFGLLSAAAVSGAVAMAAQTLLLQRFLWQCESAETGVALFLSCWLFWTGLGAAVAATAVGRRITAALSGLAWVPVLVCAGLYFVQYACIGHLRGWMGVPSYQAFPPGHLALGCLAVNVPFCFAAGWVIPTLCAGLVKIRVPVSRAFAWEALGAAAGGIGLLALLLTGRSVDPRDVAEWHRYFPQAKTDPGRFVTGGGTTFYGTSGGTFYALSTSGVSELIPETDRAMELAAVVLSQRPYAKSVLLAGNVPLAVGLALETLRPDLSVVWCPCDAEYGCRLLKAAGVKTLVRAAGAPPQPYLAQTADGAFDAAVLKPPSATTLEGTAWRGTAFAREVRRITSRKGIALFGLEGDVSTLLPEKAALLTSTLCAVRRVWPESGCFVPGAGGWWAAAQVPGLAYPADAAPARFALLKREDVFPTASVAHLYDAGRARQLAGVCPLLDPQTAVLTPHVPSAEDVLLAGWADAVREAYPASTPSVWLKGLRTHDGVRLLGLLLVALWMAPVVLGRARTVGRRLTAAWMAACGALGLVVSLSVLCRLQMRFGALYLWAGIGSCLYLGGLFFGNRCGERLVRVFKEHVPILRLMATAVQAACAFALLQGASAAASAAGVSAFCLAAGGTAGLSVPLALIGETGDPAPNAAVFVLADALGAAVAGMIFIVLVPFAGFLGTVLCFALLACGMSVCVALSGPYARLTAGVALVAALAMLGGSARDYCAARHVAAAAGAGATAEAATARPATGNNDHSVPAVAPIRGVPRKVDEAVIREQMKSGRLSDHAADFCD